jgi:hypothetical protein
MPISDVTNVNLLGLTITILMGILMFLVPRKYAPIPFLIITCFITLGQRIVFATLDFTMFRILILSGWVRLMLRGEIRGLKFNAVDKALIWWVVASIVIQNILWQTSGAFINSMGFAYNVTGTYFLFRYLIRDFEDVIRIIKCLAVIVIPLAIAAVFENATGRNVFAIFGGVPEFTPVRDGNVRCTVSLGDAILTGTFGATLMPLFMGFLFGKRLYRKLAIFAVVASTIITVLSHSSGPAIAYLIGLIGFIMWPFRRKMRAVRWGLLAGVLSLHMVMKAPVWALIGRVSGLSGGGGYYREELIGAFIEHFWEWWLIGTKYTAHWGLTILAVNPNSSDITNQFISEGIGGGLLRLSLFIAIIAYSFRAIGRPIQATENQSVSIRILLWSMGVALLCHVASFMSVSYFSQIEVLWYMLLAMISACEMIFNKGRGTVKKTNVFAQTVYQSE